MPIESDHWTDPDTQAPEGGQTFGPGFVIAWQRGPMVDAQGNRKTQNGAFVEDIIKAAVDRLEYYQGTKFAGTYNSQALLLLNQALDVLNQRTADRVSRGVEGTHQV